MPVQGPQLSNSLLRDNVLYKHPRSIPASLGAELFGPCQINLLINRVFDPKAGVYHLEAKPKCGPKLPAGPKPCVLWQECEELTNVWGMQSPGKDLGVADILG